MPSHPDHFNDCEIINLTLWKDRELLPPAIPKGAVWCGKTEINGFLAELAYASDLKSDARKGLRDHPPQKLPFQIKRPLIPTGRGNRLKIDTVWIRIPERAPHMPK
jgi:hypothetical protein